MNVRSALLVLASVAFAAVIFAQQTKPEFFAGIVLGVDSANRLLSVEEANLDAEKMTFTVPTDADIREQGRTVELEAIHVGQPVSIEYVSTATGPVARSVKVISVPETSTAPH